MYKSLRKHWIRSIERQRRASSPFFSAQAPSRVTARTEKACHAEANLSGMRLCKEGWPMIAGRRAKFTAGVRYASCERPEDILRVLDLGLQRLERYPEVAPPRRRPCTGQSYCTACKYQPFALYVYTYACRQAARQGIMHIRHWPRDYSFWNLATMKGYACIKHRMRISETF